MRSRTNRKSKKGASKAVRSSELAVSAPTAAQVVKLLKSVRVETRLEKRILTIFGVLATTAGGFIVVQNVANSGQVNTAASFSALSTLFLEYRVLGMEIDFFPIVDSQTNLTTPAPSMLALCKASSGVSPGTFEEVAQGPEGKIVNALRPFRIAVSADGFVDGLNWTSIGGTIPTTNQIAVVISDCGVNPASAVSSTYFRWTCKFLAQFRSFV